MSNKKRWGTRAIASLLIFIITVIRVSGFYLMLFLLMLMLVNNFFMMVILN